MSKRPDTLKIEQLLQKQTEIKRIYGCEEVTIGFYNNGHGNEAVDFMTMDYNGIIRCYEIKVTLSDMKSKAKKSWYGNYNYIVVSNQLLSQRNKWTELPSYVGILDENLNCISKPKKQDVSIENQIMLKESLVRSIYWKMVKYRNYQDIEKQKNIIKKLNESEKELKRYKDKTTELKSDMYIYEYYMKKSVNEKWNFIEEIEKIKDKI